jgi:NADH:ubiquinone oxidoreductase subunit E
MSNLDPVYGKFTNDRSNLLPLLRMIQQSEKQISESHVSRISRFMNISRNDVYSVASFYPSFQLEKTP